MKESGQNSCEGNSKDCKTETERKYYAFVYQEAEHADPAYRIRSFRSVSDSKEEEVKISGNSLGDFNNSVSTIRAIGEEVVFMDDEGCRNAYIDPNDPQREMYNIIINGIRGLKRWEINQLNCLTPYLMDEDYIKEVRKIVERGPKEGDELALYFKGSEIANYNIEKVDDELVYIDMNGFERPFLIQDLDYDPKNRAWYYGDY